MSVRIHDVEVKHATVNAILCVIEGEDFWVPNSQVDDDSEVWKKGDKGDLVISDWFAEKEGLA